MTIDHNRLFYLDDLASEIHQNARDKGFWDEDRNFGEMIALVHSELSEALEEHRDGQPSVYLAPLPPVPASLAVEFSSGDDARAAWEAFNSSVVRKPEGAAIELVDALIRILDTLKSLDSGYTVDELVRMKMDYNATRPHKHGKAY